MGRRGFIVTLGVGLLAVPLAAEAQQAGKVPRIGVLNPGSSTESPAVQREPFERGLRELGWRPGSNIFIEYRYGEGNTTRLAELVAELVRLGMDMIVARGPVAIRAARQATVTIPIVMASAADPVADGSIKSLARPGGNVTGLANLVWELDGKRLELLKEALPQLTRVGVVTNPRMEFRRYEELATGLLAGARSLSLQIQVFEVTRPEGIAAAFAAIDKARVGGLLVLADTQFLESYRTQVVAMASKHRLPAIYPWRYYVEIGGLMSYGASIPGLHYQSAVYVDKILKGAKPADLPVEQPTKFELVINMKTAKALGLTIPPSLLLRADETIQ
jgi:ABC-type uncharacterized transport system substrate-binding protein